jgi:hypothetical protein
MRNLIIATMLVACNTTDTTETEAAETTDQTQTTNTTTETPVDVVDEEAKRLEREGSKTNDGTTTETPAKTNTSN